MASRNDNSHDTDLLWLIVSGWPDDLPEEQELLEELRIFNVIESRRLKYSDGEHHMETYKFKTASEVVEHLIKKVAKQIAEYQQVEKSSPKLNSKDRW